MVTSSKIDQQTRLQKAFPKQAYKYVIRQMGGRVGEAGDSWVVKNLIDDKYTHLPISFTLKLFVWKPEYAFAHCHAGKQKQRT